MLRTHFSILLILSIVALQSCGGDSNPVSSDTSSSISYTEPTRISDSPYPFSKLPDTLYIIDDANFSFTQLITINSLQGLLAQKKPMIYRLHSSSYSKWLDDLVANYGVVKKVEFADNFEGLINHFKNEIDGYILTYITDPSIHYSISLSGISNAVVVAGADEDVISGLGINKITDATEKTYYDFYYEYKDQMNKNIVCLQMSDRASFLSDYSIFSKSFFFYDGLQSPIANHIFDELNPNAVLLGWGNDEHNLVEITSQKSVIVDAADWALNISTLTNFGVETKQLSHNDDPEVIENVHTVCFLMTDGDNIQWALGDFATSSKWYGSPNRSNVSIGWTMSPAMCELAPTVLRKFYDEASQEENGRDYFVAGPSGMGYIYPDNYADLDTYAALTSEYMRKADMSILNIIGNTANQQYLEPFTQQDNIDAIFYYYYSSYVGGQGKIYWVDDKPVITGRYQLWGEEFDNPESLAEKINILSTDITTSRAYSLIPVHVWTQSVDEVLEAVSLFNDNVRVVAPDEFVALIKKNIVH